LGDKQMKIGLFEASCADCGSSFAKPELGDFTYGQFLFTGERGTVQAYLEAIGHPVWAILEAAAPTVNDDAELGRFVQAASAFFADPIDGQRLRNHHVCPNCLSQNLASWGGRKLGEADVAVVSFSRFAALSEQDQLRAVETFYADFMAQQRAAGYARNTRV
jgi:hypothetical protein